MRRFLETYLGFSYPSRNSLKERLEHLIKEDDERKFVHKIIDEISHNENTDRVLKIYKPEEISRAIDIVFSSISTSNPDYFQELKLSVGLK